MARRWSSSGCGGGGTVGGAARCHFLEKQKVNVPTSPGWIWAKNMGLGKLGVINSQKFLPSGLKLQADILTRSEESKSSLQKFRWMARKLDAMNKYGPGKLGIITKKAPGPFGAHGGRRPTFWRPKAD